MTRTTIQKMLCCDRGSRTYLTYVRVPGHAVRRSYCIIGSCRAQCQRQLRLCVTASGLPLLEREREREREGKTSISVVNLEQMRSNEKVRVVPVDTGSPTQACPIARNRARFVVLFLRSCLYFAYAILCGKESESGGRY
jgi:hypothetical protein